jgi:hypothetical protein
MQGSVTPVNEEDIFSQQQTIASTYLSLPPFITSEKRIVMVDSLESLRHAERELLKTTGKSATWETIRDNGYFSEMVVSSNLGTSDKSMINEEKAKCGYYSFVGVDSEWRAVMSLPKKKPGECPMSNRSPDAGASILQVRS